MKKLFYLMVVIAVLGLIVSGCSIPLKSVVPTSEKGNPKPELGAPTLERITFIHYAKPNVRSKPVWDDDDTVDKYKLLLGGIKWIETMAYEVNTAGSKLKPKDVISTLGESLETWNTAITGGFKLFDYPIDISKEPIQPTPGDQDNRNIVVWEDLSVIYGANVIAVNSFWFNPALKVIVDSDVVFSTKFDWSLSGESGKMDLQNIATHEFGHNGLNDLYMPPCTALTMYGYSDFGDIDKRSLGTGDISGIQELYGE